MSMSRVSSLAIGLAVVLGSVRASAQGDTPAPATVTLENLDGPRAKLTVNGEATHLPDGVLLHISLMVSDRHPPVEAGFFRVTVKGGRYGGNHEWKQKTFAPLAYRTEVRLIMEVQNPTIKRFLARELGYPMQHVEVISATRTVLGSDEERASFQVQTLRTLREFQQRAAALQAELLAKVSAVPAADPGFATFEEAFIPRLRQVDSELNTWEKTRVVWFDAGSFSALAQVLFQLDWAVLKHKEADESVPTALENQANDLRRILEGIDTRLPAEPGQTPGGPR
jgi:hypothetical protein